MHPLLTTLTQPIESVELFGINVEVARHFSFGTWHNRQHAVLRLGAGENSGWAEMMAAGNDPNLDWATWGAAWGALRGLTVKKALAHVRVARPEYSDAQRATAEMALFDLAGRMLGRPALELLELEGRGAVPGAMTILESDPERAAASAQIIASGYSTNLKLKLFGEAELDVALVRQVRAVTGPATYLSGDVNCGYPLAPGSTLRLLVQQLERLHDAGLNACEDPATLRNEEWAELQRRLPGLELIADVPIRPTSQPRSELLAGMSRIFNAHPDCVGSLREGIALARHVQELGGAASKADLIIGDNSLIGPGCSAWQQIASGLGARWVEAVEKPTESTAFLHSIRSQSLEVQPGGIIGFRELRPGFGLDVDIPALRTAADFHAMLG